MKLTSKIHFIVKKFQEYVFLIVYMNIHTFVNTKKQDWKSNKMLKMITYMECSRIVRYKELPNCIQYFYTLFECFTTRILGCTLKQGISNAGK